MADEDLPAPPEAADQRRAVPFWLKWFAGVGVFLIVVGIAGSVIRLPYDTLSPGSALNVAPLVTVHGATTYRSSGDVMLLFVRERDHINLWSWLQAKLDSNIDLFKQQQLTGGVSQKNADLQAVCDMTQSKASARAAALTALGYKLKLLPSVDVASLPRGSTKSGKEVIFPAENALLPCDEIVAIDGHAIRQPKAVSDLIEKHKVGTKVVLDVLRNGKQLRVQVPVVDYQGRHIIGVAVAPRFDIPVDIKIDTSNISGPSAGLAMTLAIIDQLTPGDLTGGKRVAVTGTISPDGSVGEIGGIEQKGVSVKAAHAQIFIVPACGKDVACAQDLQRLKKRVGKNTDIEPVATLAQALRVLRDAGGAPIPKPTAA